MCVAEPGVCGIGRVCTDLPPPQDPSLLDAPATLCGDCAPGYLTSFGFSITLPEYEEARAVRFMIFFLHVIVIGESKE